METYEILNSIGITLFLACGLYIFTKAAKDHRKDDQDDHKKNKDA